MPDKSCVRLLDTVIDGRAQNVYYRKDQLQSLNKALLDAKSEILDAIGLDSKHTTTEAWIEFYLSVRALKTCHDSLIPSKLQQEEYSIANEIDAAHSREAVGIVYVEPTSHTILYSTLVAVCAAIAAGNCVIVVLEPTLRRMVGVVQNILKAVDPDLIEILPTRIADPDFLRSCIKVIQEQDSNWATETPRLLLSPSSSMVVGIVDRTANVDEAAKQLADARFSFGGKSPYAPDIVLVNEFVMERFLNITAQHLIGYSSGTLRRESPLEALSSTLNDELKDNKLISAGSGGSIVEVTSRQVPHSSCLLIVTPLLKRRRRASVSRMGKIRTRVLYVLAVRSLDDAIDTSNSVSDNVGLLSSYVFASPEACKYVIQFIKSHMSFANHIHTQFLVGPAVPNSVAPSDILRYPINAFTTPNPRYARRPPLAVELQRLLSTGRGTGTLAEAARMLKEQELEKDRPVRHTVGFFEQGFFTGLGVASLVATFGLGIFGYYGVYRWLLPLMRMRRAA